MTKKELIESNKQLEEYIQHNEYKYVSDNSNSEIDFIGTRDNKINERINLLQNQIDDLKHLINNSTAILVSGNSYVSTIRSIKPFGDIVNFHNINYQNYEIVLINSNMIYNAFIPVNIKLSSMDNIKYIFDDETNKLKKVKLVNY